MNTFFRICAWAGYFAGLINMGTHPDRAAMFFAGGAFLYVTTLNRSEPQP